VDEVVSVPAVVWAEEAEEPVPTWPAAVVVGSDPAPSDAPASASDGPPIRPSDDKEEEEDEEEEEEDEAGWFVSAPWTTSGARSAASAWAATTVSAVRNEAPPSPSAEPPPARLRPDRSTKESNTIAAPVLATRPSTIAAAINRHRARFPATRTGFGCS
jgi:hypothetical protein